MECQLVEGCLKASLCICLGKFEGEDSIGNLLSLGNNPNVGSSGTSEEERFTLVPSAYYELLIAIIGKQLNIVISESNLTHRLG